MEARRKGEDIIDFSMGNPDGPAPQHIIDKLKETAAIIFLFFMENNMVTTTLSFNENL